MLTPPHPRPVFVAPCASVSIYVRQGCRGRQDICPADWACAGPGFHSMCVLPTKTRFPQMLKRHKWKSDRFQPCLGGDRLSYPPTALPLSLPHPLFLPPSQPIHLPTHPPAHPPNIHLPANPLLFSCPHSSLLPSPFYDLWKPPSWLRGCQPWLGRGQGSLGRAQLCALELGGVEAPSVQLRDERKPFPGHVPEPRWNSRDDCRIHHLPFRKRSLLLLPPQFIA